MVIVFSLIALSFFMLLGFMNYRSSKKHGDELLEEFLKDYNKKTPNLFT